MKKSIKAKPKKRGRPATGRDPMMGFRASAVLRSAITNWAACQPDKPTLSDAARRLIEIGIEATRTGGKGEKADKGKSKKEPKG
jgi:hypothetical protein